MSSASSNVTKKELSYSCPGCNAENPLNCDIFQTNFRDFYPATCPHCKWSGDVAPFKTVDFFCPSCQSWWRGHKVRISGRSWLEFLSITFFCTTCAAEVTAKPCQILRFECGSDRCQASQVIIFCLSMSFKVIYFDGEIFHLFAVHLLSKLVKLFQV